MPGRTGSYRPPRVGTYKPVGPMRKSAVASMRKLSGDLKDRHPFLGSHEHVTDAAKALERGQPEAAIRHLNAAIGNMTPQSLRRHGLLTDEQHDAAKKSMDAIHRHLLLTKDVMDLQAKNSQLPYAESDEPYKDDDLTVKPTAPGGNRAMNAPDKMRIGGPDVNVAKPQAITSEARTKQVAASNSGDLTTAIELVGPHGFIHGWIKVGSGDAALSGHMNDRHPGLEHSAGAHMADHLTGAADTDHKHGAFARLRQTLHDVTSEKLPAEDDLEIPDKNGGPVQHGGMYGQMDNANDVLARQVIDLVGPKGFVHGWRYVGGPGLPSSPPGTSHADPYKFMSRKTFRTEGTSNPTAKEAHDFPAAAERMKMVTRQRAAQASEDEGRIASGKAPLHPELAHVWPSIYAKGGINAADYPKPPAPKPEHEPGPKDPYRFISSKSYPSRPSDVPSAAERRDFPQAAARAQQMTPSVRDAALNYSARGTMPGMRTAGALLHPSVASGAAHTIQAANGGTVENPNGYRRIVELAGPWLPSKEYWSSVDSKTGSSLPDKGGSSEEKADNHIKSARAAAQMGNHKLAMQHLARASQQTGDAGKQSAINKLGAGVAKMAGSAGQGGQLGLANQNRANAELARRIRAIELSAQTGRPITVVPHPFR
jgi:hypothetical protein